MADTVAVVTPNEAITVAVSEGTYALTSSTTLVNPTTVGSIASIGDVDTSTNGLQTGSILIYKTTTNKWTSTRTLDAQNMEGGEF
jgi:hypothetical protein